MSWDDSWKKQFKYCGSNVYIGDYCKFLNPEQIILHDNVRIDPYCLVSTALEVGPYTQIMAGAKLIGGKSQKITLKDWTFIGYNSLLICASESYNGPGPVNEFWFEGNKIYRGDIVLNSYSGIASNCVIFPGIVLPEGCTIGASSLVYTKDELKPWSIFLGNPLRFHKERDKETILSNMKPENIKKR